MPIPEHFNTGWIFAAETKEKGGGGKETWSSCSPRCRRRLLVAQCSPCFSSRMRKVHVELDTLLGQQVLARVWPWTWRMENPWHYDRRSRSPRILVAATAETFLTTSASPPRPVNGRCHAGSCKPSAHPSRTASSPVITLIRLCAHADPGSCLQTGHTGLEARQAQSLSPSRTRRIHIRCFSNPGCSDTQSDAIGEVRVRLETSLVSQYHQPLNGDIPQVEDSPWPHAACRHCSIWHRLPWSSASWRHSRGSA